jgi:DNA-binding LacI/PurR family transcriptional regulator
VPVLRAEHWDEAEFAGWLAAHRPDAVVLHQSDTYVAEVERYLARRRVRIPRDLGLALLDKNPNPERFAGVCQDPRRIGASAAELLLSRIAMGDFAWPTHPITELVLGRWNEARSLRAAARTTLAPA